jgi:hypothetical protein
MNRHRGRSIRLLAKAIDILFERNLVKNRHIHKLERKLNNNTLDIIVVCRFLKFFNGVICCNFNNIYVNLNICAVSEGLVLAAKAGADPYKVYQAIRGGLAGSAVLDAKAPMICARNFKPGGKISINHKDIKNVLATAHALDVPLPFTAQLFEIQQALKAHGHMDDDHGGYVQYFEELADVIVKGNTEE